MRVFFLIPTLAGGGAERVVVELARGLDREKFQLSIVLFHKAGAYLEEVPTDVRLIDLGKKGKLDLLKMIWRLAKIIETEKPHMIFSSLTNANIIALLARKLSSWEGTKILVNDHNYVSTHLKRIQYGSIYARLLRLLYPDTNGIIAVSKSAATDLIDNFCLPQKKVYAIYNPIDIKKIQSLKNVPLKHPWFSDTIPIVTSVGRLTEQKGYTYLLKAFASVRENLPCRLVILGEGEERSALEQLAHKLEISTDVAFLGFQANPYKYISRSTIFALASLWEGFPVALIEAMACNVPVVATRCLSGPDEVIEHRKNGLLVPVADESSLAESILELLRNDSLRNELARNAKETVMRFDLPLITSKYEALFWQIGESG